jgi:hypothetical protein
MLSYRPDVRVEYELLVVRPLVTEADGAWDLLLVMNLMTRLRKWTF